MAYATYITDALVCGTRHSNTADASYLLFTREAGMLFASARSVREERSRQRFALQDFSLIRATLIKGKAGWRIGSVEAQENFYAAAPHKEARGSVVALVRFLRRFVHGEEPQPELYDYLVEALVILPSVQTERPFLDAAILVRALELLGYVSRETIPAVVRDLPLSHLSEAYTPSLQVTLERIIDTATTASHL